MIHIDFSKCTGCKRCETTCAFFHTGRINRHLSRIRVLNLYEMGIDGPVLCLQCQERYCMSCPVDAISIGAEGQIIVSPTICTGCNICENNCPIGAIEIFNEIVYVCDLCGGNPKCVQACTEGAITWQPETAEHPSLSDCYQETHKMTSNQKRQWYLKHVGTEVRKKWREKHA